MRHITHFARGSVATSRATGRRRSSQASSRPRAPLSRRRPKRQPKARVEHMRFAMCARTDLRPALGRHRGRAQATNGAVQVARQPRSASALWDADRRYRWSAPRKLEPRWGKCSTAPSAIRTDGPQLRRQLPCPLSYCGLPAYQNNQRATTPR